MAKALIVIDYTYDFIADDGRLTCGAPGQEIESYIATLIQQFVKNGDPVVFATDVHDEGDTYHPETSLFPPHNIRGTQGRELFGAVGEVFRRLAVESSAPEVKWMDKTRYSSFAGTDLEMWLRSRHIEEVHLVGVCTDICVLHTAVDAYNKGFAVVVHEKGVASFDPEGHAWALRHFAGTLGASVIK